MRLVGRVAVAQADDEHIGFDLDDARDEMPKGVHQDRADCRARLGTGNAPEFLLEHCGDQDRTVAADGEVLQEILFREACDRSQSDCGDRGDGHETSSLS
jgi:hypothetical protein